MGTGEPVNEKLLGIYLNDHLAGSTAGIELARRSAGANEGTGLGDFLARLVSEIDADRDALIRIMELFGVRQDQLKKTAAWTAEKLGRLKPNGQLTGYSPLSRLVELEGLHVGISGKLSLWQTLSGSIADASALSPANVELPDLVARAERQLAELEPHRLEAARQAFEAGA